MLGRQVWISDAANPWQYEDLKIVLYSNLILNRRTSTSIIVIVTVLSFKLVDSRYASANER